MNCCDSTSRETDNSLLWDDYYPFGLTFNSYQSGGTAQNFKYNDGTERDLDLGVDMTDFRVHDPTLGRWWQIDPIHKYHESPYAWVTNNPIRFNDPFGLATLADVVVIESTRIYDNLEKKVDFDLKPLPGIYKKGDKVMKHRDGVPWVNVFLSNRTFKRYDVDDEGYIIGLTPIIGHPPSPNFAPAKLVSSVKNIQSLLKIAKKVGKNPQLRKELNKLFRELARGNYGAGKGSKQLFGNIHEMRG